MKAVNVEPYLARVEYRGSVAPRLETLRGLHVAHVSHIPFENIDVLLDRGIDLDPEVLHRKLVAERRGGYCFEHNLLFGAVLQELGFGVTYLSARVRFGAVGVRPRTHMLLMVTLPEGRWFADVGFGSDGLLEPVLFEPATESAQPLRTYRVMPEGGWCVMQSRRGGEWMDLYTFTLDAHERIDYEVLNHFTATHPRSIFRSLLLAQLTLPDRRLLLRNRELTIETMETTTRQTLAPRQVMEVLRDTFGIELAPGTVLNVPEG